MKKPNVVMILVDDMGYGDFSVFNNGLSNTPTLDGLIGESICFTQHYTASPVCNPSRAALMTGRYPHRTGSIDTLEWRGLERLALKETTLADVFKKAGYATGLVGKWHLGAFDMRYHPNSRGFDEAVCFRGGMHDYYKWRLEYNDTVKKADGRYLTDLFTEEAAGFIERHRNEPFFLHLTYNAPHTPLQVPEEEIRPFAEKGKFNSSINCLYGMIHRMDTGVAKILDTLKKNGLEENTIVFFSSDNGPQLSGDIDRFNCGFRGAKGRVYEGGIRVPAILRWPAGLDSGREINEFVHFCDWFPTMLALTGIDIPEELKLDGIDISSVLKGEKNKVETKRFWQWNRYTPVISCNAAMRDNEWKLVRPAITALFGVPDIKWLEVSMYNPEYFIENGIIKDPEPEREIPPPPPLELYNIKDDPLEKNNLAGKYPERVQKMKRELETWFEEVETERQSISCL